MSAVIKPGPGLDCIDCGSLSEVSEAERAAEDCPECGQYAEPVEITVCPATTECESDDHHHGYETEDGAAIHVGLLNG